MDRDDKRTDVPEAAPGGMAVRQEWHRPVLRRSDVGDSEVLVVGINDDIVWS